MNTLCAVRPSLHWSYVPMKEHYTCSWSIEGRGGALPAAPDLQTGSMKWPSIRGFHAKPGRLPHKLQVR